MKANERTGSFDKCNPFCLETLRRWPTEMDDKRMIIKSICKTKKRSYFWLEGVPRFWVSEKNIQNKKEKIGENCFYTSFNVFMHTRPVFYDHEG